MSLLCATKGEIRMRGFEFKAKLNRYYYNDITGSVTCLLNDESLSSINSTNEYKSNSDWEDDSFKSQNEEVNLLDKVKNYEYPASQLILITTEACNFRCKYCVYSGEYSNSRIHSSNNMNIETAKLAISKYLSHFEDILKNNIAASPIIGFFGGEPLLNFNLIKESVYFSKSIYNEDIAYTVTTNGALLNKEIIDFFIKNKFYLNITLNGDQEEHDRLRVFANGKGSFNDIINGLSIIKKINPEYYRDYVGIFTNFDTGTDLLELRRFLETSEYTLGKTILIDKIIDSNTNWYSRYSREEKFEYNRQLKELKKQFIDSIRNFERPNQVELGLFGPILRNILNRNILNRNIIGQNQEQASIIKYGGSCIPGTKIAVSWDGTLHLCEKVNLDHPIGTVENWLDYSKIEELIDTYNRVLHKRCNECNVQNICTVCFKDVFGEDGNIKLISKSWCDTFIEEQKQTFSLLYSFLEEDIQSEELCEIMWGVKP